MLRLTALVVLLLVGTTGCDTITGSGDGDSILGTWVVDENGYLTFLRITSSTIAVYEGDAQGTDTCFYILEFSYSSAGGDNEFTLTIGGETFTLTIRREGDNLRIIDENETEGTLFSPSEEDVSAFEECSIGTGEGWGGTDPSIDCSALPQITIGTPIDGELADGDNEFRFETGSTEFWYYDLYGLTLGSSQTVDIALTSPDFDTYLYLYEDDGTYIDENDDANTETFNSALSASLSAGCYRVEVTSWGNVDPDSGSGVGSYTLTVD